jgi:hypothetical protein
VIFIRMVGAGHAFGGREFQKRRLDFFDKYLRGRQIDISDAPIEAPTAEKDSPQEGK